MFYVYENCTHKRGRAHQGSRSYCNQDQGTQESHFGSNGHMAQVHIRGRG